ncbi:MAG TPA: class I SAM-dependent methyltransferase [Solirubrobacteraceae bacterium]|nr:class I SAM-dependent methyltransferase [Solirubrobacteraceae bacterium]
MSESRYVPAAGRAALTGVYDTVVALTMRERRWRPLLAQRLSAGTPPGGLVVDVGAGTGTLAVAIATARPDARVIAVDGDPRALALARRKEGAELVEWREGLAGALDLAGGSTDTALMSLLLHHLDRDAKLAALRDVRRVLRPGGALQVADWGRPQDPLMLAAAGALQIVDTAAGIRDHLAGRVPQLIRDAGFTRVERYARLRTGWGGLELLEAA